MAFCCDEREIDSWKRIKPRLRLYCARKDYDRFAVQKSIVHRKMLDVKLFARVFINEKYMLEIQPDFLKKWNKSEDSVFETARKNSLKEIGIDPSLPFEEKVRRYRSGEFREMD